MEPIKGQKLSQAIQEYVVDYCTIERGLTPKTIKGKGEVLRRFKDFLGDSRPLELKNCRAYSKHLYDKGWKPSSIKADLKVIKAFVNFLQIREYIEDSFASKITLPKARRRELQIIPAELADKVIDAGVTIGAGDSKLSKASKLEHQEALKFILRSGLRISELLSLHTKDINLEDEVFKVNSKGGQIDLLPVPKDQLEVLRRRCVASGKVFSVTAKTMNIVVRRGCVKLGVKSKLTVHSMRHIFCTSLLKNGVPLQIVSRLMRHSSIGITDAVYSHYIIEDLALALNSKHPLISYGLTTPQIFDLIEEGVQKIASKDRERFTLKIERNPRVFKLEIGADMSCQ